MRVSRALPMALSTALLLAMLLSGCPNPVSRPAEEARPDIYLQLGGVTVGMSEAVPFSATLVGETRDLTFTIENRGNEDLLLTGGPVSLSGSGTFTVQKVPATTIEAGANSTFIVRFSPLNTTSQEATVSIANNDPDGDPFSFTVTGTGSVVSGSILIKNGDLYTNSTSVTLTLSPDDPGSVEDMLLSNSADFAGAGWEGFQASRAWTLVSADGTKTVYVKFRDGEDNESSVFSDDIILDATPPDAPGAPDLSTADDLGVSATDDLTNRTTGLTFTGSDAEAGSTIQLYANSVAMTGATATAAGDGTWTSADAALSEGSWNITARATDPAGNASDASTPLALEIDITGPSGAPSILKPMQGANTGTQKRPTFTWTTVAGALRYDFQVDTDSGFSLPQTISLSYHDGTSHTPSSDLAVSTSKPVGRRYYLRVRAADAAGNRGPWSHQGLLRYVNVGRFDQDVNGDGYSDLIVGIPGRDTTAGADSGNALLYFGGPSMDSVPDLFPVAEAGGDSFGISVAFAGDVNADGYGDFLIGASGNDAGGNLAGAAYLYFGGSTPNAAVDLTLTGEGIADQFGRSVAPAGDVNGDGYGDLIIGAPYNDAGGADAGRAYVYFGGTALGMDESADLLLTGEAASDSFGSSVASAGDANGDGYADLIVGAPHNDAPGTNSGRAYLYLGDSTPGTNAELVLGGAASNNLFGLSVASAGDIDSDGYADLIVGAPCNDAGGFDAGQAYLFLGGSTPNATADLTITGAAAYEELGFSVTSAGDTDGDGYNDLIVGARHDDAGSTYGGRAYLYLGSSTPNAAADLTLTAADPTDDYDLFGGSVAAAGDCNADGCADLIVGAWRNDTGGTDAGRAYVYFGGSPLNATADLIMTGSDAGDYLGYSVD